MGSAEPDHRPGCTCTECGDWEIVFPDDNGEYDPWATDLVWGGPVVSDESAAAA